MVRSRLSQAAGISSTGRSTAAASRSARPSTRGAPATIVASVPAHRTVISLLLVVETRTALTPSAGPGWGWSTV